MQPESRKSLWSRLAAPPPIKGDISFTALPPRQGLHLGHALRSCCYLPVPLGWPRHVVTPLLLNVGPSVTVLVIPVPLKGGPSFALLHPHATQRWPQGLPLSHGVVPVPLKGCPSVMVFSPCHSRVAPRSHGVVLSPPFGGPSATVLSPRPSRVAPRSRCCPPAPQGWPFGHGAVPPPLKGGPSVIVFSPCPSREAHQSHGAVLSPLKGGRSVTVLSSRPSRVALRSWCCPRSHSGLPLGHCFLTLPL